MTRPLAPALLGLLLTGGLLAAVPSPAVAAEPAPTVTHLAVHADELIATVEADPGSTGGGTDVPTGRVVFTVDGVRLGAARLEADPVPGVAHAVLPRRVRATGSPLTIDASYGGDATHGGSHEAYRRTDPVVEALVTSTGPVGPHGWYRTPTEVTFACTDGSAHAVCPAAVSKRATQATSVLRRTVRAEDGGATRVEVSDHRVDPWAPRLAVSRVGEAPYPRTARPVRCTATDSRSGVDGRCTVAYGAVRRTDGGRLTRSWVAAAHDRAGNERTRRGSITVRD